MFNKYKRKIIKEFKKYPKTYLIISLLFLASIFLRVWRIDKLLEFNYDQGRDALVIQALLNGKLVFIGPTTGIEGIFVGPFYYYFLAIGYFLGGGDPAVASLWQTIFISLGFILTIYLLKKYVSAVAAIIYGFISTFSFYWIKDNRWLSNPAPTAFFIPLAVLFLIKSLKQAKVFLPMTFLVLGIMLQLEASTSFFILGLTVLFIILNRKRYNLKSILLSIFVFFVTLTAQVIFELKHNFLVSRNFINFVLSKSSENKVHTFEIPTLKIIIDRLDLYAGIFFSRLKVDINPHLGILFLIFLAVVGYVCYKNRDNFFIKITSLWFLGTLFILFFYQGNNGQIFFWYFIPLMQLFFILLSAALSFFWFKNNLFKAIIVLLLTFLITSQLELIKNYLNDGLDSPTIVVLGTQVQAVKYVINDAKNEYNVDTYLPPVIPYPYTYLFKYYGQKYNHKPTEKLVKDLYTIHEADIQMPSRENAWLKRQSGIGRIEKQVKFGGITVEKRERLKNE